MRANNIYVEELATKKITQLTSDGSEDIINGTSDWVNEEELFLRNCIRWSPDSRQIAYWQFDQSGVGEYTLINDTESEYPVTFKYKYPQPGTTNSAVRVGIVPAAGGPTQWVKLAGDPRQNYVAQMDWAGNSDGVLLEYLDRAQKTNQFILGRCANRRGARGHRRHRQGLGRHLQHGLGLRTAMAQPKTHCSSASATAGGTHTVSI